jgi:hypothetical protein
VTALGLFSKRAFEPLETKNIEWNREFRGGNIIPFCGNLVIEKLNCSDGQNYVRVLNNQVPGISSLNLINIVPLEGCGVGPSGFTDGMCEVAVAMAR